MAGRRCLGAGARGRVGMVLAVLLAVAVGPVSAERLYVNDKKAPESLKDLRKIQEALQNALPQARAATVGVDLGGGAGSAVVVSADGLILTAAHVSGAVDKELTVIFEDGRRVKARTLGLVANTDAAMMQITEEGEYPYVELDHDDTSRLGDWVFSLGHSGGFDKDRGVVVRLGRIVQVHQSTVQSDCNLIGGDSGGPLFDLNGKLIGIHSRVGASKEQNMHVPIREFLLHWDGMREGEFIGEGPFAQKPVKGSGFLGVLVKDHAEGGAEISFVGLETPAVEAGLLVGDVVLKIDEVEIEDRQGYESHLNELAAGDEVVLTILRDGKEETVEVKLAEKKQGNGFLGLKTGERDGPGVEVLKLGKGDPAEAAGLQVGDVILKFGAAEVNSREAFSFYLRQRGPGETIELTVQRDGEELTIEVELDEP